MLKSVGNTALAQHKLLFLFLVYYANLKQIRLSKNFLKYCLDCY